MGEIVEMDGKGRIVIPSTIRDRLGLARGVLVPLRARLSNGTSGFLLGAGGGS